MLHRSGKNNPDGSFDWIDALADAGIIAGMTFFATLGGTGVTGALTMRELVAALIAAGGSFFGALMLKRGLTKGGAPTPST